MRGAGSGDPNPGTAHRNGRLGLRAPLESAWGRTCAVAAADADAAAPRSVAARGSRPITGPEAWKVTVTVPSTSVRYTLAPVATSRSTVARVGCPYGLSAPAEAMATRGRTASRNASVLAVRLP